MKKVLLFPLTVLVLPLAACAPQQSGPAKAELPAGKAYAEGFVVWDGGQR